MKIITPEGTEEVRAWDLLDIRSGNGISLSRSHSPSPLIPNLSLPPHLSNYQSASQFQLSGKLWVPKADVYLDWPGFLATSTWTSALGSYGVVPFHATGAYMNYFQPRDESHQPTPEPVKCQRDTPAIGFRAWQVRLDRKANGQEYAGLQGANQGKPWPGRHKATAVCTTVIGQEYADHVSPVRGCGCGLYAYHEPDGAPEYMHNYTDSPDTVMGAVIAWGRIIEYENGFRAQYARPIAISAPPNDDDLTHAFLTAALAEKTASLLQLPFIPYKNLVTYAREFGERLNLQSKENR